MTHTHSIRNSRNSQNNNNSKNTYHILSPSPNLQDHSVLGEDRIVGVEDSVCQGPHKWSMGNYEEHLSQQEERDNAADSGPLILYEKNKYYTVKEKEWKSYWLYMNEKVVVLWENTVMKSNKVITIVLSFYER